MDVFFGEGYQNKRDGDEKRGYAKNTQYTTSQWIMLITCLEHFQAEPEAQGSKKNPK